MVTERQDLARIAARRRRAEASWYAWALDEFARYLYALGMLAVLLFVLLQMAASWYPSGRPAPVEPRVAGALAVAFVGSALYLGVRGYQLLWRPGGLVDRAVARREGRDEPGGDRETL